MIDEQSGVLPPWAVKLLLGCLAALATVTSGGVFWFVRTFVLRPLKDLAAKHEVYPTVYASKQELKMVQDSLGTMMLKSEFIAHMEQLREDNEIRFSQMREDRLNMHVENRDNIRALMDIVRDNNKTVQDSLRGVHDRVDGIFDRLGGKQK